ncbi:MAG: AMP-binding protein [Betaproteobacteria bacterium]|nr:AMP-binding protein [Betaproteobacteria bacterium]
MTARPDRTLTDAERARIQAYFRTRDALGRPVAPDYAIAQAACDRWAADPARRAMLDLTGDAPRWISFAEFGQASRRLGSALKGLGVAFGDRVIVGLPQSPAAGTAHLAVYRLGAIAVPISIVHGSDAIAHRVSDSGARVGIIDADLWPRIADIPEVRRQCRWIVVHAKAKLADTLAWDEVLATASDRLAPAPVSAETPAMIIYTSGTTGNPKGALHAHRVVDAHAAPIGLAHGGFPQRGDLFWSPADWAWAGGLVDCLLSAWSAGVPIVAFRGRHFEPEVVMKMMAEHGVKNTFLPPTALRMLRLASDTYKGPLPALRSIMTGGEATSAEVLEWAEERLGTIPNEAYGQTEASCILGNASHLHPVKAGSPGFSYPGSLVSIIALDGPRELPAGEVGEMAVRADSQAAFLGYWGRPDATAEKVVDGWLRTGDLGRRDADGYFWFNSRKDDVISSAGYRIGPNEIESCIETHPAVRIAAVIGIPDRERGQVVKAVVELRDPALRTPGLEGELKQLVRTKLAPYEVPRVVEFVEAIPRTVTGKLQRNLLRK